MDLKEGIKEHSDIPVSVLTHFIWTNVDSLIYVIHISTLDKNSGGSGIFRDFGTRRELRNLGYGRIYAFVN